MSENQEFMASCAENSVSQKLLQKSKCVFSEDWLVYVDSMR